jgi:hypothetical protein
VDAAEVSFDSAVLVSSASFCCLGWEIKNKNNLLPFFVVASVTVVMQGNKPNPTKPSSPVWNVWLVMD